MYDSRQSDHGTSKQTSRLLPRARALVWSRSISASPVDTDPSNPKHRSATRPGSSNHTRIYLTAVSSTMCCTDQYCQSTHVSVLFHWCSTEVQGYKMLFVCCVQNPKMQASASHFIRQVIDCPPAALALGNSAGSSSLALPMHTSGTDRLLIHLRTARAYSQGW